MARSVGGCLGRLLVLGLVLLLIAVAWLSRDRIAAGWVALTSRGAPVSAELAAQADEKLAALSDEEGSDQVALNESELQSLIEYRWSNFLPPDVVDPKVGLADGRVSLEASVATARFGRVRELEEIVAFLPDTTALRAVGTFVPLDSGRVALEVHELGAASIPIPRQLIPTVLSRFRGADVPGLAPNAVAVPLPAGIRAIYISGDSMVFVATRAPSE